MTDLSLIKHHYPGLAEELEKKDNDEFKPEELELDRSAAGTPVLKIRGLQVHSARDPQREAQRQVESLVSPKGLKSDGEGPIIVLGFGLGYVAEAAALAAQGRPVIIAEKHRKLLKLALETRDLSTFLLKTQVVFILGGKGSQVIGALSLFEKKEPVIIRNRTLIKLDEEWYGEVERGIRSWVSRADINRATLKRFGSRWVRNLARNLKAIRDLPGINRLENILQSQDIPVFLAAAGPTLDGAGPLIQEIHNRCLMVAVDTSLRFILARGIEPDFIVSIDPQYWNYRHLERASAPNACLVAESGVYPACLRHPFKGAFLCGSLFPLSRFLEDRLDPKGEIGTGGSVATAAWDFARRLGAAAIWTAGLDLSFPGLKTHFKGALFEDRSLAESFRFAPGETWSVKALRDGRPFQAKSASGGSVLTDERLSLYAAWFENRFSLFPEIRNYNLSAEGLALKGMETASPDSLLSLPLRREKIDSILGTAFGKINDDFSREKTRLALEYEKAQSTLREGLEEIKSIALEAADTAGTLNRRYRNGSIGKGEVEKVLKKLDAANQSIITSEVRDIAGFLFPEIEEQDAEGVRSETFRQDLPENEQKLLLKHLEFSQRFYQALAEAARYNLNVLFAAKF